jgi:hypothetical protein
MLTKYVHYKNFPDVRELAKELKDSISVTNTLIKNYTLTNGFLPKVKLIFGDENVQITYDDGQEMDMTTCNDYILGLDYDDFKDSKQFGETIKGILKPGGFLKLQFPKIPVRELDFFYVFGEDTLKIGVCHNLPF